ncbi:MAG: biotin--[acetyl-CoA-carboxylase] ligase [Candidatus Auribacterota bacterium]|jgi:BirA family biotin operon repressor/biotin-[acetyl-CoA-carboxylase] ligase|nr:biotin--[acetyl-CoA-carboxylase] ligase [Candidatus Auribacterota bacterium]
MPSKELIVHSLLQNQWVHGTDLAETLGTSRTAIWNNITVLKNRGYDIESNQKEGYRLVSIPKFLYPELVKYKLGTSFIGRNIIHYMSTGSTNDDARELCNKGAHAGTVVIAEDQTKGRGRCNRSWTTSVGKSIAMSLILKPEGKKPREAYQFTMMTAAGISDALMSFDVKNVSIKWPNDVLINGKKVAGILTELNGEMDMIRQLIIGIGINVNQDICDFGQTLPDATSVKIETGVTADRLRLIQTAIRCIDARYVQLMRHGFDDILNTLKQRCCSIGKKIHFNLAGAEGAVTVKDIASDGGLMVIDDSGNIKTLYSGDIQFV